MRALGYVVRFATIVVVMGHGLLEYAVGWAAILGEEGEADKREHLAGRILRETMSVLGATFIKLGQVMSTRPDLFAPAVIAELKLLQDRLPPFDGRLARREVERALGRPLEEVFSEFDVEPVAAASVAQVHRARLVSGAEVAVKVLRPDVRDKTERDGSILLTMARFAERLSGAARHANLVGHAEHFLDGVLAQTDLRIEAQNYEVFRANFASTPKVVFPHVYPEASAERAMTMDFCRGHKVDALPLAIRADTATRLRQAFLKMLFEDGFLHADLHPGNLLVDDDGVIMIFDVGLAKRMNDDLLEQYIDFNRCLVMGSSEDFVSHLRRYHSYIDGVVDWDRLTVDAQAYVSGFRGKPASELEFGAMIEGVFALARRYGVRPVTDMTLIMVGLVTSEGIGKQLSPESDSFGEVATYLMPILARRGMLPS
ncbi:MAG: ABC1 kinase family protein [Sandaracinaceae bacterium]